MNIFLNLTNYGIDIVHLYAFKVQNTNETNMSHPSKIAQLGIINILNQMKNPLTNIRLCVDMLDEEADKKTGGCNEIIKNSAISLENSIRDLCTSFEELGVTIHLEADTADFPDILTD